MYYGKVLDAKEKTGGRGAALKAEKSKRRIYQDVGSMLLMAFDL